MVEPTWFKDPYERYKQEINMTFVMTGQCSTDAIFEITNKSAVSSTLGSLSKKDRDQPIMCGPTETFYVKSHAGEHLVQVNMEKFYKTLDLTAYANKQGLQTDSNQPLSESNDIVTDYQGWHTIDYHIKKGY